MELIADMFHTTLNLKNKRTDLLCAQEILLRLIIKVQKDNKEVKTLFLFNYLSFSM
jgi:hypothetical protein